MQKLVVTDDDKAPYMKVVEGTEGSDFDDAKLEPVVWGYTYSFTVSWSSLHKKLPSKRHFITHHFVVNEYDDQMFMYLHTFQTADQFTLNPALSKQHDNRGNQNASKVGNQKDIIHSTVLSTKTSKVYAVKAKAVSKGENPVLKILSFNIWNTNDGVGGNTLYSKRIQQLGEVSIYLLTLNPSC